LTDRAPEEERNVIERIPELVNGDPAIVRWGRTLNDSFMVEVGAQQYLLTVRGGRVESVARGPFVMRPWRFAIRARSECWEKFWQKVPAPGWHDLFALLRRGDIAFEGDQRVLMAYLLYLKLVLATPRRLAP
jgi:hypothetical protein